MVTVNLMFAPALWGIPTIDPPSLGHNGKVTVDIFTDNDEKPHIQEQLELDQTGAVVIFDVLHGRREPIELIN